MSTDKRDRLKAVERQIQAEWDANGEFVSRQKDGMPKFFATFPYPYMNGTLHMGHAFTMSRVDFYCRYRRLNGFNVLFPFAWHGTGMPIVACAGKLKDALDSCIVLSPEAIAELPNNNQIKILYNMNIPIHEIPNFIDPYHWIKYFPRVAHRDLTDFGLSADFTRSFVTTDINPYYDSFIKWQFEILRRSDMVKFGKKFVMYSPKDGQPCADHDRSVGEGVEVKEFVCLRFAVVDQPYSLLVTTTRPETFFGLTNLWVGINETYVVFSMGSDTFVAKEEAVRNLRYQHECTITTVDFIKGSQLAGMKVSNIPVFGTTELPIVAVPDIPTYGSGIFGSVPGDSTFDYKHVTKHKLPIDIKSVTAVNNQELLDFIKKGLTDEELQKLETKSVMKVGPYAGQTCLTVRMNVRKQIMADNFGFIYCEPASLVISRSGDKCVVCLTDQWFINYAKDNMKEAVNRHIESGMELFDGGVKEQMLETSRWITDWPCSRSKGLGTKLFDTGLLIDSLSDSTIYMAFYTVAHLITGIPVEKLSFDLWEYIFRELDRDKLAEFTHDELETIDEMKKEFAYWYPLDMRVSGKDLLGNHLVMCLYNHAAVWGPDMMPKSFAVNGHANLNGKKMSKSDGNFMTLRESLDMYGADATRLSLANACGSDGTDDANFTHANANEAILKLTSEMEYCKELIDSLPDNTEHQSTFWDTVFANDINRCIQETQNVMERMNMQKVVVSGFYNLLNVRDAYRTMCEKKFIRPSSELLRRYLMVHLGLIGPVCPHYATEIWNYGVKHGVFTGTLQWPKHDPVSHQTIYLNYCFESFVRNVRAQLAKLSKRKMKTENVTVNVIVYSCYCDKEVAIIRLYRQFMHTHEDPKEVVAKVVESADGTEKGLYGKFANYIKVNVIRFGPQWLDRVIEPNTDEYDLIRQWAPTILGITNFNIELQEGSATSMSNENGPARPYVKIE